MVRSYAVTETTDTIEIAAADLPARPAPAALEVTVDPEDATVVAMGEPVEVQGGTARIATEVGATVPLEITHPERVTDRRNVLVDTESAAITVTLKLPSDETDTRPTTGIVSIDSDPPSTVWYRGRLLGRTPVQEVELPAGYAPFTLELGGKRHEVSLVVPRGGRMDRRFSIPNAAGAAPKDENPK
jgi:hypothetical protein